MHISQASGTKDGETLGADEELIEEPDATWETQR